MDSDLSVSEEIRHDKKQTSSQLCATVIKSSHRGPTGSFGALRLFRQASNDNGPRSEAAVQIGVSEAGETGSLAAGRIVGVSAREGRLWATSIQTNGPDARDCPSGRLRVVCLREALRPTG